MSVVQISTLASHLPRSVHLFGGEDTLSPVGGCSVVSAISGLDSDSQLGMVWGITLSVLDGSLFLSLFLSLSLPFFAANLSLVPTPT